MRNLNEHYQDATSKFIQQFDNYWNDMLDAVGTKQAQLTVGNRLRPQIALWGYLATVNPNEIGSHDFSFIANIAVSIEMIHKASLLIDDWIDNDEERHGSPAFHIENTPQYTVLFALNLIGQAMSRLKNVFPDTIILPHHYYLCLDTLIETIHSMAIGALKELQLQGADFFDRSKIQEITQLETAKIIGNSMLLGYYAGIGDKKNVQVESIFKSIGDQCGYLFQALNDLEAFGNPHQLMAHKGTLNLDLLAHRKNLAVSALYEIANKYDRIMIEHANEDTLLSLMKKYRVVETLKAELVAVYSNVMEAGASLRSTGLPAEWCEGLQHFLLYVKTFAEKRLKG